MITKKKITTCNKIKPRWELADIFRLYGEEYQKIHRLPKSYLKIIRLIKICRTKELGGHIEKCNNHECGYEIQAYNSCKNRHCPKCQTLTKERWISDRKKELLPVGYFHLVFTLPHALNPIILYNRRLLLTMLFAAANETLQAFSHDPEWRLNGQLGFLSVLHTWSQTLMDHFHLHCIIPEGVMQAGKIWKSARKTYLFKTKSLAKYFRRVYLEKLRKLFLKNKLVLLGNCIHLKKSSEFDALIDTVRKKDWIVYAKKPFAGPHSVLEYLGRYTHRVAISNHRIKSIANRKIIFSYKDRSDNNQTKLMTLDVHEFIRRFLLHILPKGFMKIRSFGFLANVCKKKNIECIRHQLGKFENNENNEENKETIREMLLRLTGVDIAICPKCGLGQMSIVKEIKAVYKIYKHNRDILDSS